MRRSSSYLQFLLIDLVWRGTWLILTLLAILGVVIGFGAEFGSFEWQGPDLAVSRPIIFLMAGQQLWNSYSGSLLLAIAGVTLLTVVLWLTLEAFFRGGRKNFWIFLGSSASRVAILGTSSILLGYLAYRDQSRWAWLGALVILFGIALILAIAETLIRRDAVELWATDLFKVAAAIGLSLTFEVLTLSCLAAVSAALILSASRIPEFLVALVFTVVSLGIWSVFHSYLLVVRFSTVDIMRRDVRGV